MNRDARGRSSSEPRGSVPDSLRTRSKSRSSAGEAAELELLEEYDATRQRWSDDYGRGQRVNELRRRERELAGWKNLGVPFTLEERGAAFDRVGAPRLRRAEKNAELYGTRSSRGTLKAWQAVARWAGRS